MSTPQEHPQDT